MSERGSSTEQQGRGSGPNLPGRRTFAAAVVATVAVAAWLRLRRSSRSPRTELGGKARPDEVAFTPQLLALDASPQEASISAVLPAPLDVEQERDEKQSHSSEPGTATMAHLDVTLERDKIAERDAEAATDGGWRPFWQTGGSSCPVVDIGRRGSPEAHRRQLGRLHSSPPGRALHNYGGELHRLAEEHRRVLRHRSLSP